MDEIATIYQVHRSTVSSWIDNWQSFGADRLRDKPRSGRTPKLNKSGARDHWPHCFSALVAGGSVPGGTIVGASDAKGAYPAQRPVNPTEFAATIYQLLGIDTIADLRIRPFINNALPVGELVGA